ncbi:MAG: Gfo/Idh/MocA family oxidoreductase [Eubacteriales bacterium]
MKINVGILGMGNMGQSHGSRIYNGQVPHMQLAAVCDIDPAQLDWARKNLPDVPVFATAEEMYDSGLIDSVIIAVPHYDHAPYAIQAFEKGLHVYCEKPAGVYTKQVLEMNRAAEQSGKVFALGFQQRTNPAFRIIRDMVRSGELGHIKKVIWIVTNWYRPQAYHDSSAWRSTWRLEGGGTIVNQNPHNIDLFQWMFGMPSQVMAVIDYGKYYDIEVDDDVNAIFRYDSGTVGIYTTATGEQPGTNRLEISCDMGKLVYENNELIFWKNPMSEREFNRQNKSPFGHMETEKIIIDIPKQAMQPHNALLENFAQAVLEGTALMAPGVEGIKECLLADALYYSDWQGQQWIHTNAFDHDGFWAALQEKINRSTHVKQARATEAADMNQSFQQ